MRPNYSYMNKIWIKLLISKYGFIYYSVFVLLLIPVYRVSAWVGTLSKSYEEINEKIRSKKAVVYTAEEIMEVVKKKGIE